jgi:hypothetical protein
MERRSLIPAPGARGAVTRLRLPAGAQGAAVRSMIGELMTAVFEHRAV